MAKTGDTNGPPNLYDVDTEHRLVGAAIIDNTGSVASKDVDPGLFSDPALLELWQACHGMAKQNKRIDISELPPDKRKELGELWVQCTLSADWTRADAYIETLREMKWRRVLELEIGDLVHRAARTDDIDERKYLLIRADELKERWGPETAPLSAQSHSFLDLMATEVMLPPDVIEGLVPGESVTMLSGDGGIGKSYILIEAALMVAQGLPWLGMETTRMPVLIIDLENRLPRIANRVQSIARGHSIPADRYIDIDFIFECDVGLHSEDAVDKLCALVERCSYGLIILDSLVDFLEGLDENSNTEMATVCKRLRGICQRTNASILAIHHVPKNGSNSNFQSARGASALKDNIDCSIQVLRRDSAKLGPMITMRHDKARDFAERTVKAILNWKDGMFNTSLFEAEDSQKVSSTDKHEQAIMDCLSTTSFTKRSDVMREAKGIASGSDTTYGRKMKGLIEEGIVIEDTSDKWDKSTGVKLAAKEDVDE